MIVANMAGNTIAVDGKDFPMRGQPLRLTHAILTLPPPVHRDALCKLLWPEKTHSVRMNNLHVQVAHARKLLALMGVDLLCEDHEYRVVQHKN